MSLIEDYQDIERNIAELEAVRGSGRGREFELYRSLIGKGRVFLPYLVADRIAFAPSRYLGYVNNSVVVHSERTQRDGKETTPRIPQVLAKAFGFTISNSQDDLADAHLVRFCETIGVVPDQVRRTYWITPEIGDWLAENPVEPDSLFETEADDYRKAYDEGLEDKVMADMSLPETTRKTIVKSRIGQGLFRLKVLQTYGSCHITNLSEKRLLIASHIKPWRDCCHNPNECLSPHNALLLSPTWDALFDKGFISFADDGLLLLPKRLSQEARQVLGVKPMTVALTAGQISYMRHHRSLHRYD